MSEPDAQPSVLERLRARFGVALGHLWRLISNAVPAFAFHRCIQLAASMAYYALLSVFPTAIVLAAAVGFVLDDPGSREDVVNYLLAELPLTDDGGRDDIERLLDGVIANSGTLGAIGLAGLLFTASSLISATRNSVNVIFSNEVRRGAVRGKALDVALVLGLGILFAASFAITLITQLNLEFGGRIGDAIEGVFRASGALLPLALSALVFLVLYRVLPTDRPTLRDIWPGVVVASLGYELLKRGFSVYLDNFANYSAIYGSLGAIIAFMVFVWLASMVFLFGAEMAAIWPGARRGDYDPDPEEEDVPFADKLRDFLGDLFRRNRLERPLRGRRGPPD